LGILNLARRAGPPKQTVENIALACYMYAAECAEFRSRFKVQLQRYRLIPLHDLAQFFNNHSRTADFDASQ
jgi:hypothetical protein